MFIVELEREELKNALLRVQEFLTSESEGEKTSFIVINTVFSESIYIDSEARDEHGNIVEMDYYEFSKFSILKSKRSDVVVVNLTGKVNQILSFISSSGNNEDGKIVIVISTNYCVMIEDDKELKLNR